MSKRLGLLALWLLLALACPAWAQERILAYDSEVAVQADGSIDVEERIRVRAEGQQIRRGIYRDFPTRYRDRHGNRVVVGFEVQDVLRDGKPEPWFTERMENGVRLNTGNDDLLPVPAEYTYTLRYRTTRQLGFFASHDELYWNAIGTGWAFPIESASVHVRLPGPVATDRMQAEAYTGVQGVQGRDYRVDVTAPGEARWTLARPLGMHEGLTIVLGFPKGLVAAPGRATRLAWFLADNRGVLVALAGLLWLLAYCVRRWNAVGRDPAPGIVIARYEPPAGYSPAALRFIGKRSHDNRCFSADLLALAVAGFVRIERRKGLLKDRWTLARLPDGDTAGLPASQRGLLAALFAKAPTVELTPDNAAALLAARAEQNNALERAYAGRMFQRNGSSSARALLIVVASIGAALLLSGGFGLPVIFAVLVLMLVVLGVFASLVIAPTTEGRKMMDEIEGLKRYLQVAERDELARMAGPGDAPQLDARRYQLLLPYAVALEVEDAWTRKFTDAVGVQAAAEATSNISWYQGDGITNLSSLSNAVGSSLASQIASASSPPGSSSGGGGGGSSGGGGGGGGGGGR